MKKPKCKVCKQEFVKLGRLHVICGYDCAVEYARLSRDKKDRQNASKARKEYREEKEKQKTRADWIKEVHKFFNPWVRLRDKEEPCISCGRYDHEIPDSPYGKWDCGHYLSVGSHPELRFEPLNAHKQCKSCNGGAGKYSKKNHTVSQSYRINLINKVGLEKVEWLESKHEPAKYTIPGLKELKSIYKEKLKQLKDKS